MAPVSMAGSPAPPPAPPAPKLPPVAVRPVPPPGALAPHTPAPGLPLPFPRSCSFKTSASNKSIMTPNASSSMTGVVAGPGPCTGPGVATSLTARGPGLSAAAAAEVEVEATALGAAPGALSSETGPCSSARLPGRGAGLAPLEGGPTATTCSGTPTTAVTVAPPTLDRAAARWAPASGRAPAWLRGMAAARASILASYASRMRAAL